jgi:acyl-CoA reductase-like NAD-dependent aldehyde dehydrogenase
MQSIIPCERDEDAVRTTNDSPYGLTGALGDSGQAFDEIPHYLTN